MRYARALACAVIAGALLPCVAAAGDASPQPSAIAAAPIARDSDIEHPSALPNAGSYEPFAGFAPEAAQGPLQEKWNAAATALRIDIDIIAACHAAPDSCESLAAKNIIAIVDDAQLRQGRARIGGINRAINLAIAATSDRNQFGVEDKWASPLMTFASGRGDCEDYALAKYAALRAAGMPETELRLLIVKLAQSQTDHAVLAVRHENRWLVLDNRRFAMLDVAYLDAVPLFSLRANEAPRRTDVAAGKDEGDDRIAEARAGSAVADTPYLI